MKLRKNINSGMFGVLIAISLTIFIASCSSSSSPNSNNSTGSNIVHPKLGSIFTDSAYTRDTSFNVVPQSGMVIVYTLTDTNFSIAGKTNVFEFASNFDTIFLHYESNGDVSNYSTFGIGALVVGKEWVTLPTQSQGTIPITPIDTFFLIDTVQITGSAKGTGTETETIGTHSVSASKITINSDAYAVKLMKHATATVNT
ncbi:MAG: hypothetical protein ACHQM6_02780, partial [Candidatus Kapaibacterium sp.]